MRCGLRRIRRIPSKTPSKTSAMPIPDAPQRDATSDRSVLPPERQLTEKRPTEKIRQPPRYLAPAPASDKRLRLRHQCYFKKSAAAKKSDEVSLAVCTSAPSAPETHALRRLPHRTADRCTECAASPPPRRTANAPRKKRAPPKPFARTSPPRKRTAQTNGRAAGIGRATGPFRRRVPYICSLICSSANAMSSSLPICASWPSSSTSTD